MGLRMWHVLVILVALQAAGSHASLGLDRQQKEVATKRLLSQLSALQLWSGSVACSNSAADAVYEDAYGTADYGLKAPMSPQLRMPVAQNSQLLVAIALHQLAASGRLNLTRPASELIDPADFGLAGRWCPRVKGAAAGSACEEPTTIQLLTHTSGLWDSQACTTPQDWQAEHCAAEVAGNFSAPAPGASSTGMALTNWTLGQPLATAPGSEYAPTDDGYRVLQYIVEKVSGQALGAYLNSSVFTPAGMTSAYWDAGAGTLQENLVDNSGYLALFNGTAGAVSPLYVGLTLNASIAPNNQGGFSRFSDLERGAGTLYATAKDLHALWRTLFSNPSALGLTPEVFAEMTAAAQQDEGPNYAARGLSRNVNESSFFGAGSYKSWFSFPSVKLPAGSNGTSADAPVCVLISNLSPQVEFADDMASRLFVQQCEAVKGTPEVLQELVAAEPTAVDKMSGDERQIALLSHLCYMAFYEKTGSTAEEYVRDAVAAYIWDARSHDLEAAGLVSRTTPETAAAPPPAEEPEPEPEPSPEPEPEPELDKQQEEPPAEEAQDAGNNGNGKGKGKNNGKNKGNGGNGEEEQLVGDDGEPRLEVGPVGTYTDFFLECIGGRARCPNLALASMGYQCMNGQLTACCATAKAHDCQPVYKIADKEPKNWEG